MSQSALPFPASTVVLIRPGDQDRFDVFMTRRPEKMDAYAGAYVFPGGRVEQNDCSEKMLARCHGLSSTEAQRILGGEMTPAVSLGYWVAALRELFEEAGIGLFICEDGTAAAGTLGATMGRFAEWRTALQQEELDFSSLLESERLLCDVGRLIYFFHRITPEHYPIRFDTRFYLAALPPAQTPLCSSEEVAESLWISPAAALERGETGEFRMAPPTFMVLGQLAGFASWSELSRAYSLR